MGKWKKKTNSFIINKEAEGRYKLLQTLNLLNSTILQSRLSDYQETKSPTARYDASVKVDNILVLIEVKCRSYASDTYPTQILEQDKYDALVKSAKRKGKNVIVWYVNYYSDGICRIFNLSIIDKLGFGVEAKLMNYRTFEGTDKIYKNVYMLRNWDAVVEYNINEYEY